MGKVRQYSESANTAYIEKSSNYFTEDGEQGTMTEIYKKVYTGPQFWKVWLNDLLTALGLISNSRQLDVVLYILEHTNPSNNMYVETIRDTAEYANVSLATASKTFKKLQEANIIARKHNGAYMVKPTLLMKGDNVKQRKLVITYDEISKKEGVDNNKISKKEGDSNEN